MKRSPALLKLSREHHTALVLALQIARADDPETMAELLVSVPAIFRDEVDAHFQREDDELLPRLAAAGALVLVERTLAEHREMRNLVAQMSAGDVRALKPSGARLKAHVHFEERELFVTAETILPAAYLGRHA